MDCEHCLELKEEYASLDEYGQGLQSIRKALSWVNQADKKEGLKAFRDYRKTMKGLASMYGFKVSQVTAAFVATSPNNDYWKNLRSTVSILKGINEGIPDDEIIISTYNACKNRALAYARGQKNFLKCTEGEKTRNFYQNLMNPFDAHPVTVDGHMVACWNGYRMTIKQAVRHSFNYEMIALGIREVAQEEGILANQLQSVLWFTWKRVHRVYYTEQIDFFSKGTFKCYVPAYLIKPFPFRKPGAQQEEPEQDQPSTQLSLFGEDHDREKRKIQSATT